MGTSIPLGHSAFFSRGLNRSGEGGSFTEEAELSSLYSYHNQCRFPPTYKKAESLGTEGIYLHLLKKLNYPPFTAIKIGASFVLLKNLKSCTIFCRYIAYIQEPEKPYHYIYFYRKYYLVFP